MIEAKRAAELERDATIFELLVTRGLLSRERFTEALLESRKTGAALESVLLERCRVPKRALGDALSSFYKCPFLEHDPKFRLSPELMSKLNPNYLRASHWVPLWREHATIHVLLRDPHSASRVQDIQQLFPGNALRFYVGLSRDVGLFLDSYARPEEAKPATIDELLDGEAPPAPEAEAEEQDVDESDSVVVRLASQLIADACKAGASDIHVEPYKERDMIVRLRVDGECVIHQRIPARYRQALVARFKIMAGLDIAERRRPQDGKITVRGERGKLELRLATLPTAGGLEDVVLRVAASTEPVPLEKAGLSPENLEAVRRLLDSPHGLFLCVGPTGSGKTTTLHSCLFYLNGPDLKIWTAEDPVEITQYGLRQVQVHPKIGLTFAAALRAFLRADPDVIMVGEMRDKETADAAVEASMTGHLVLSTLHTNSAVETVARLLDMGLDSFNYSDALLGVLSQRLVRRLCADCRAPCPVAGVEGPLFRGAGCQACGGSGYKGRVAIHELLVATPELKRLIQRRAPAAELAEAARAQGMKTLADDGLAKCRAGETDYGQVLSATTR